MRSQRNGRRVSAETAGEERAARFQGQGCEDGCDRPDHPETPSHRSHLDDGTRVSAETSRRISCDCGTTRVQYGEDGAILNVGRKTRSIPPALRRALEVRDRGCRFPGCGYRFADAHHVKHWADGGETSLDNTLLLCRYHHRLVHEGGWTVEWWGRGRPVFMDPRGHVHFEGRWEPPAAGNAGQAADPGNAGNARDFRNAGTAGDAGNAGNAKEVGTAENARHAENGAGQGTQYRGERPPDPGHGPGNQEERSREPGSGPAEGAHDLVATLLNENRALGIDPDGYTASARWKREVDIPGAILYPAEEALL